MKKKLLISLISLFTFILIVTGISYSYYIYNMNIVTADLASGSISINVSNNNSTISLTNVSPMSDSVGKLSNDYIDFTVSGVTDFNTIYYEINLVPSGENTLKDDYIKVYLTDQNDNQVADLLLLKDLEESTNNATGKVIYTALVEGNSNGTVNNYSQNYRLRLWVDENYVDLEEKEFSFELYLYAKNIETLYTTIKNSGNALSYASVISSHPTFTTQDTVWENVNKKTVYYYNGASSADKSNVLFAGFCWQVVRTTDNGGVRLIYNGVAQNNQCLDTRGNTTWKSVNGIEYTNMDIRGDYFYADGFDYDLETGKFSLVNVESAKRSWTQADYKSFIGKYTCLEDKVSNCDNIYYIGSYDSSTNALVEKYSIGNLNNYRHIGVSVFDSSHSSVSNVGYMFNEIYPNSSGVVENAIYGKNIKYENGNYIVYNDDPTETINTTTIDEYHHYSCGTTTTCSIVKFYVISNNGVYYYVNLSGGDTEIDLLKKMINYKTNTNEPDEDINVYDSTIKGYLDNWYDKNLKDYEKYIDISAIYCNDRTVTNLAGWNKLDGTYQDNWIQIGQFNANQNLSCPNVTDRFSKNNSKARLNAPIGLLTEPERGLMGASYAATGSWYWGLSPRCVTNYNASVRRVGDSGGADYGGVIYHGGVRAVITLKPGTELMNGDGSKANPYQVGELVDIADNFMSSNS